MVSARGRLRSADRIAAVLELSPEDVGRVVIYEGPSSSVAAVVPSNAEPDRRAVRRTARIGPLEAVTERRASELTGYLPESIPPAGLPKEIAVVVDRSFDGEQVLYFPGGEPRAILKVRGRDLIRAVGARVGSIARRRSEHGG